MKAGKGSFSAPSKIKTSSTFFVDKYAVSFSGYSLLLATLFPLRTRTLNELAKDVFFPTFLNHSIKEKGIANKILWSIAGISLDLFTMIPRLSNTPLRVLYNYTAHKDAHPLTAIFKDFPDAFHALTHESLSVQMSIRTVTIVEEIKDIKNTIPFFANIKTTKEFRPLITNPYHHQPLVHQCRKLTHTEFYQGTKNQKEGTTKISNYQKKPEIRIVTYPRLLF